MSSSHEMEHVGAAGLQAETNLIEAGALLVADDGPDVTCLEDEGAGEIILEDVADDQLTLVGMASLFDQVWKCLQEEEEEEEEEDEEEAVDDEEEDEEDEEEDNVGIIGVYGMGGVGKTALLKQIYNRLLDMRNYSDVVIWVVVSYDLQLDKIQEQIGEQIGLSEEQWKNKNLEERASDIFKVLKEKKFVLLMDDLWERVDLTKVGVPLSNPDNASKIVFTTRSLEICSLMEADQQFKVKCLADKEAWMLFRALIGGKTLRGHPAVIMLAKAVCKECYGLPLALVETGRAMAFNKTREEWGHALLVLTRSTSSNSGSDDELKKVVFYNLKRSYDNLQNDTFKSCLLYCCLFSRNGEISKRDLIDYWIGEGILDYRLGAGSQGYHIIDVLLGACLLEEHEEDESHVKMHILIYDMCLWIASEIEIEKGNFFICSDVGLTAPPDLEKWKNVTRMSVSNTSVSNLSDAPNCPDLQTLFLNNNQLQKISGDFFQFMSCLKVLNLSKNIHLQELPSEISKLISLQHLDLSHTGIESLPNQLGALRKLECLNLEHTFRLHTIPRWLISKFSVLHVLRLWQCGFLNNGSDSVVCDDAQHLIEELFSLKNLSMLSISLRNSHALQKLLSSYRLHICTQSLCIRSLSHPKSIIVSLANLKHLNTLWISGCECLEEVEVDFVGVSQAKPESPCSFYFLHEVIMTNCPNLRDLTLLILAPNLKRLQISDCSYMEEIINVGKLSECLELLGDLIPFSKLKFLTLENLPNLRSIHWFVLPFTDTSLPAHLNKIFNQLREVCIINCPKLSGELPDHLPSLHKLVIQQCKELLVPKRINNKTSAMYGPKIKFNWNETKVSPLFPANFANQVLEFGGTGNKREVPNKSDSASVRDIKQTGHRVSFEVMDDGFKWRKYGEKSVKNGAISRNYYKCSAPGCSAKKRVERDRDDPSHVKTTYEGVHNHQSVREAWYVTSSSR